MVKVAELRVIDDANPDKELAYVKAPAGNYLALTQMESWFATGALF
jgi:hypothetical protein